MQPESKATLRETTSTDNVCVLGPLLEALLKGLLRPLLDGLLSPLWTT